MNPVTINACFESLASLGCRLFVTLGILLPLAVLAIIKMTDIRSFKAIEIRSFADVAMWLTSGYRPSRNLADTLRDYHRSARMDTPLTAGDLRLCSNHGALAGRPFCEDRFSCRPDEPVDNDSVQGLPPHYLDLPSPHYTYPH